MEDNGDSENNAGDGQNPPSAPVAPEHETPAPQTTGSEPGQQPETPEQKLDRDMVKWTRAVALLTGALVFVGICQIGAALLQWSEMKSGGEETANLVTATQNLAAHAKDQADAMDKLRRAGEGQAKATGDLKDITKTQAGAIAGLYGAIKSSADASAKVANAAIAQSDATKAEAESVKGQTAAVEKSLLATRDMASATRESAKAGNRANDIANKAFLSAERPWTGVATVQSGSPQVGQDFKINISIQNTGRSPSLNTRAAFNTIVTPWANAAMPALTECVSGCSSSTLLPNGSTGYAPTVDKALLTDDEVKKLNAGIDTILLVGRVDYVDDTGASHMTLVCNFWNGKAAAFSSCTIGNLAN